jgi:ATP-dependent Clp protease adaptor protein ClpS
MEARCEHVAPKTETGTDTRLAPLYRVLIHNDDKTTMDFVMYVLRVVFPKLTDQDAIAVMLEAHHTGVALVCVETLEQAEFHVDQAHSLARGAKFPLTFTCEPEEGNGPGA